MSRKPYIQFYPADWRGDLGLKRCGFAARGVWIELLGIMHESPSPGFLLNSDGTPCKVSDIRELIGGTADQIRRALDELERNRVFDRDENRVIFCRKMVRKSAQSRVNSENAQKRWDSEKQEENYQVASEVAYAKSVHHARERDRDLRVSESQDRAQTHSSRSSAESVGSNEPTRIDDLLEDFSPRDFGDDGDAWKMAVRLFELRGGMSERRARPLIGRIASEYKLRPLEIAKAAAATWKAGTRSPEGYFRKVAVRLIEERGDAPDRPGRSAIDLDYPLDVQRQWMREFMQDETQWRPGERGPRPGNPLCKIDPGVLAEFGFELPEIRRRLAMGN